MGITILIIDAERIFAEVVAARLDAEQDMTVVATCRPDGKESLENASRADAVLLDADLPGGAANSLCQALTSLVTPPRVIMLSNYSKPERIVAALRAGASAWVRKDKSFNHLLRVVRGTACGETWLSPAEIGTVVRMLIRARTQQQEQDTLLAALTPREREILACLADGAGRSDVAERLYLSANTVRTHLRNLMAKLGVHSTLEAVAMIRRGELSDLPLPPPRVLESCGGHGRRCGPVRVRRHVQRRPAAGHPRTTASPPARSAPRSRRSSARRSTRSAAPPGREAGTPACPLADQRRWVNGKVVSGADQKRLVPPPATWEGVPVLVEVDNVEAVWMVDNGGNPGTDRDTPANVCMVGQPRSNLTCIHIEIDGRWKARGWSPPDFPMRTPIDIQGYVYWDNPHESEGDPENSAPSNYILGHYESGWEIHPVSAWRLHRG